MAQAAGARPVWVFQVSEGDEPGHFGEFLDRESIVWHHFRLDRGDLVPREASGCAGIGFMGGPMSVNDPLPWVEPVLGLIRDAVSRDIPYIGHCLGGQLLSKALGGVVSRNPVKEIGWSRVEPEDNVTAREWLGEAGQALTVFQWHGETFTIPDGATRILRGEHCANQAFVVHGRHLGMQCHVEMTDHIIATWCGSSSAEVSRSAASPAVEPVADIRARVAENLPALNALADRLYTRWARGLAR